MRRGNTHTFEQAKPRISDNYLDPLGSCIDYPRTYVGTLWECIGTLP